jgi:hypothetical protein
MGANAQQFSANLVVLDKLQAESDQRPIRAIHWRKIGNAAGSVPASYFCADPRDERFTGIATTALRLPDTIIFAFYLLSVPSA